MNERASRFVFLAAMALFLASCKFASPIGGSSSAATNFIGQAQESAETLTVLSVTGGLCLIAGMALLVVTSGKKGWYPVIGGIILVVLNYLVAKYDDYLFYPLVVCTGMISAAWTYKIVRQILLEKKAK